MKTLSIVVVNYNTGKLLEECLESIRETTDNFGNPKTEVTVIDNASEDKSIKSLSAKAGIKGGIKVILNKENLGFARAVNQGIKIATGEYFLLLNPDTKVIDGALFSLLNFAEEHGDAGVVGARLLNPNSVVQASAFHFPTVWRAIREFWLGEQGVYSKYTPKGDEPIIVDAVVGAAFLITPQARKIVGLLDERYFMYFEDLDYCRRVKKEGLKVYYLPSVQIIHHHGVSGQNLAKEENQWRRLIPSSKIYHGLLKHYLIIFIIWSGLKFRRILG